MSFPSLTNDQYKFFNIPFYFCDLKSVIEWVERRAAEKALVSIEDLTEEDIKKIKKIQEVAGIVFLNKLNKIPIDVKEYLTRNCQPYHYALCIQDYLFFILENYVDKYRVDFPEDTNFDDQWQKFRIAFAKLRYEDKSESQLCEKTLEYLAFLSKEKENVEQCEFSESSGIEFKQFLLKILQDPDLLEFSVAQLTKISPPKNISTVTISVEHLLNNYKKLYKQLLSNVYWTTDHIEQKLLSALAPGEENAFIEKYIKKLLDINNITKKSSSLLIKADCANLAQFIKKSPSLDVIKEEFGKLVFCSEGDSELILKKEEESQSQTQDVEFENIIDLVTFRFEKTRFRQLLNIQKYAEEVLGDDTETRFNLKDLFYSENPLKEINSKAKVNLNEAFVITGMFFPKYVNLKELSQLVKFLKTLRNCHIVLNAYFIRPSNEFFMTQTRLTTWAKGLKNNQRRIIQKLCTSKINHESSKEIETPRKVRKSRKSKKKPVTQHSTCKKESKEKEKDAGTSATTTPTLPNTDITLLTSSRSEIELLIAQLETLTENATFTDQKIVLKEAHMYLKDLALAEDQLKRNLHPSSKIFYLITLIQSSYFYLEQFLRNLQISDEKEKKVELSPATHNLKRPLNALGLQHQVCSDVPYELYLANFWTRSPFEQIRDRKRLDLPLPQVLSDIRAIYHKSPMMLDETVKKTMGLGTRIVEFSQQFTSLLSLKDRALSRTSQSEKFRHELHLKINELDVIKTRCQKLLPAVSHTFRPKFKQAICHMELVEGILHEINLGEFSSELFSLLIRGLLFWENTVLEELLQTIYGLKTGIVTNDHRLIELYNHTNWQEEPLTEEQEFLTDELKNVHNLARYPFSFSQISTPLHGMFLQGELLREHPELGLENPFELNSPEQKTALNFLPVPKEGLDPKMIIETMNIAHEKILNLIENRILPEIEQFCLEI